MHARSFFADGDAPGLQAASTDEVTSQHRRTSSVESRAEWSGSWLSLDDGFTLYSFRCTDASSDDRFSSSLLCLSLLLAARGSCLMQQSPPSPYATGALRKSGLLMSADVKSLQDFHRVPSESFLRESRNPLGVLFRSPLQRCVR